MTQQATNRLTGTDGAVALTVLGGPLRVQGAGGEVVLSTVGQRVVTRVHHHGAGGAGC